MSGADDERHPLLDAAVAAELDVSPSGETEQTARRHLVLRVGSIVAGVVILVVGVALLALPGPGLVVVAVGLGLLAREVPWAQRLLDRVTDRLPRDADGKLPRSAVVTMVVAGVGGTAVSLWFAFGR